jgi:PhnB protein
MKIVPYLNFAGNCGEAFKTYQELLGGKLEIMTYANSPMAADVSAEWRDKVMHAYLDLGTFALMASDVPPQRYAPMQGVEVSLHPETTVEAERLFKRLSEGGKVVMELQETFWASRFAMFVDRFGTPWMINCSKTP